MATTKRKPQQRGPARCDSCGKQVKLRPTADKWRLCFTCFAKAGAK